MRNDGDSNYQMDVINHFIYIYITPGYSNSTGGARLQAACSRDQFFSTSHNMAIYPGPDFPKNRQIFIKVTALGRPQHLLLLTHFVLHICNAYEWDDKNKP